MITTKIDRILESKLEKSSAEAAKEAVADMNQTSFTVAKDETKDAFSNSSRSPYLTWCTEMNWSISQIGTQTGGNERQCSWKSLRKES